MRLPLANIMNGPFLSEAVRHLVLSDIGSTDVETAVLFDAHGRLRWEDGPLAPERLLQTSTCEVAEALAGSTSLEAERVCLDGARCRASARSGLEA